MERELIASGTGGQGVQIAARILAQAAAAHGLRVMLFGMFGGSVRGGRSECTLVVSDEEIEAPPIVPETWSAIGLHPEFFEPIAARLRPGGLALLNADLFDRAAVRADVQAIEVPMTAIAEELGSVGLVSMVALGAYVAATDLVPLDAILDSMRGEIPPYRADRIPANEAAIARGAAAVNEVTA